MGGSRVAAPASLAPGGRGRLRRAVYQRAKQVHGTSSVGDRHVAPWRSVQGQLTGHTGSLPASNGGTSQGRDI